MTGREKLLYTYNSSSIICALYFALMMGGLGASLSSEQLVVGLIVYLVFGVTSLISFFVCKLKSVKSNKWLFLLGPLPAGLFVFVMPLFKLLELFF